MFLLGFIPFCLICPGEEVPYKKSALLFKCLLKSPSVCYARETLGNCPCIQTFTLPHVSNPTVTEAVMNMPKLLQAQPDQLQHHNPLLPITDCSAALQGTRSPLITAIPVTQTH